MMRMLLILLFTLFSTASHASDGPLETVVGYLTAMNSYDFAKAADYYAESDCVQFKRMMIPLLQMEANAGKSDLATMLFGRSMDMQQIGALYPCSFVAKAITSLSAASNTMNKQRPIPSAKILGGVKESDDLVHFVVRSSAKVGDNEVSSLEVVSAKQEAGIWHIQMSEKIKGLSSIIQQQVSAVQQQQNNISAKSAKNKKTQKSTSNTQKQ